MNQPNPPCKDCIVLAKCRSYLEGGDLLKLNVLVGRCSLLATFIGIGGAKKRDEILTSVSIVEKFFLSLGVKYQYIDTTF